MAVLVVGSATPAETLIDIDETFLPTAPMRLVSRIVRLDGPDITGEVDLGDGHWVYPHHFPGDPIFPGSLMIEAAGQVVALWAWAQGQRGRPRLVKTAATFHCPVVPKNGHLTIRAHVRRKRHLNFATIGIWVNEDQAASLDAVLAVLPAECHE